MSRNNLYEYAFLEGTGMSYQSVLASERYAQLVESSPRVPHLTHEQTATMMLLGERLADRAFDNLPVGLRRLAARWSDLDTAGQEKALQTLFKRLGADSVNERRAARDSNQPPNQPVSYLPHQQRKWIRNEVTPNCLGMAQMLIGFGRATGAPILLGTILIAHDQHALQALYRGLGRMHDALQPYESIQARLTELVSILDKSSEDALRSISLNNERAQAHHALVIRTKSDWWIVDPYFETLQKIDSSTRSLDHAHRTTTQRFPRMAVTHRPSESDLLLSVEVRIRIIEQLAPFLGRLNESREQWTLLRNIILNIVREGEVDVPPHLQLADQKTRVASVLALYGSKRLDAISAVPSALDRQALLVDRQLKAERNKRLRNQVTIRFVQQLVVDCYNDLWDVLSSNAAPPLAEYAHPSYQLGVHTINQIALEQAIDVPELCLYSNNQWILHDTLAAVSHHGTKRHQQVVARLIARLREKSWSVLPQLQHLI